MSKILMNGSYSSVKALSGWNWMEQGKWGGNCDSDLLQSPIAIAFDPLGPSLQPNFDFEINLANSLPYSVNKNGEEVVIKFDKEFNTGFLKAKYGEFTPESKDFRPTGLSFRFPAEHKINGNRYDGEVIIEFREITSNMDPKIRVTEALRWVFPVMFDPTQNLNKQLEELNTDFWRYELERRSSFIPKDIKTHKRLAFDLNDFAAAAKTIKTQYAFYLGSQTTPPCLDRVVYIINLTPIKIPNCQFKILRENSLISNRTKETHARNIQDNTRGGAPAIRKILWIKHKPATKALPIKQVRKIMNVVKKFNPLKPVVLPEVAPKCEIKREISK
jgi:carbonic anhydrase